MKMPMTNADFGKVGQGYFKIVVQIESGSLTQVRETQR